MLHTLRIAGPSRASDAQAREQESLFDVDALVAEALEQTEIRKPDGLSVCSRTPLSGKRSFDEYDLPFSGAMIDLE